MTNQIDVFTGTDGQAVLTLLEDGSAVKADTVTSASLYIDGSAFNGGSPQVVDTTGPYMDLQDSNKKVEIKLGGLNMKPGSHTAYLTVFDSVNTNGLPFGRLRLLVSSWPQSV